MNPSNPIHTKRRLQNLAAAVAVICGTSHLKSLRGKLGTSLRDVLVDVPVSSLGMAKEPTGSVVGRPMAFSQE
jgi:hypothetical protein